MAKQTNKAGAVKITLSQAEQCRIAKEAGAAKGTELSAREQFAKCAKQLRDAKVTIGKSVRTCKVAQAFIEGRFGGTAAAASTKANALNAFRAAVNDGKAYDENAKRKEKAAATKAANKGKAETATDKEAGEAADAPAKGKTHIGTAETATTYSLTIARKGSAKKAAQSMRDLLNKMRDAEEYSPLCALLIDALDEFDGNVE